MFKQLSRRVAGLDWRAIEAAIADTGHAVTPPLLDAGECAALAALYDDDGRFRSTIDMARYRFGQGQYRYFAAPLPPPVQALRTHLYARLAPLANRMQAAMDRPADFPPRLAAYLERCHAAGQCRPTPLLLRYRPGDYNCLHQDLYGELRFPLQAACLLSRPQRDFQGGEFLLVEQRPRAQSIGHVVPLVQGAFVIFPVAERPVAGMRGHYRCVMRHGVSRLLAGERLTLGLIFHDAA